MSTDQRGQVESLFRTHGTAVLGYLARRTGSPEDAADLLGDVMLVVWRRRRSLPVAGEDKLWMYGVARHVLANHRRHRRRHDQAVVRVAEQVHRARRSRHDVEPAVLLDLHRALDALDPTDREILSLVTWEGLTSTEVGTPGHAARHRTLAAASSPSPTARRPGPGRGR